MPFINWYPGHIAKAERKLKEQLKLVDVVIEVIDARIPISSQYENLQNLILNKPKLLIMNKIDLADTLTKNNWKNYLQEAMAVPVLFTNSTASKDISSIVKKATQLGQPAIDKLTAKGLLPRPVRAMVVGMPNVGKSSIINKLIKRVKAKTGHKAGVTRQSQWVRVNPKLELLDTPGIIPMRLDNQDTAVKLAFVSSVSDNCYDYCEISQELINILYKRYKDILLNHYKLEETENVPNLYDIANSRKWFKQAGEPDVERTARVVLSDFRNGRIGKFTLEDIPES